MSVFRMTLPDVGEGVAEAELVEWHVAVGDDVTPDTVIAEVLTDKATVEVYPPVGGVVAALHGEPGDVLAVGGDLVEIDTGGAESGAASAASDAADIESGAVSPALDGADGAATEPTRSTAPSEITTSGGPAAAAPAPAPAGRSGGKVTASPAVRARARDLGIALDEVAGSGPDGRVTHADLDRRLVARRGPTVGGGGTAVTPDDLTRDVGTPHPVRGVRRRIASRLTEAWQEIPHITYVEAVDVTELERLRSELNRDADERGVRLTILPVLATAMALALADQPRLNAHYDHDAETLTTYESVDIGIATQTDDGLLVPVVRHVEALGIWELAAELARVTAAARDGSATRDELTGSTITITSLGALGGMATTPILNAPEVAIVGVNKMETRPVWRHAAFEPRQMLNLSSSFDHRMVDGWDAATFVQRVKTLLESPALLFVT